MNELLSCALSCGADYADLFCEDTLQQGLLMQDQRLSEVGYNHLHGAGIRALAGERTGYASVTVLNERELRRAALFAATVGGQMTPEASRYEAQAERGDTESHGTLIREPKVYHGKSFLEEVGHDPFAFLDDYARSLDPRVVKVRVLMRQTRRSVSFVNSLGESYEDLSPRTVLMVTVVLEQHGRTETGHASEALSTLEPFATEERLRRVAETAVAQARLLFKATQIEGGQMPVVMAAGASGILLHEAIGHAFEADFIRKGTSIFTDKLGAQVASRDITIVDDGLLDKGVGSYRFDDEGVPSQRTVLVHHGRLESFIHDRISAAHFGVAPTGNGRRESFRHAPLPRMRNTYMLAGEAEEQDLIRSVKRGIYARDFTNGQVQIGAGDFTFYMKLGFLIEDGRLTRPIRDLNITGNGPRALADISMVAKNALLDPSGGMCGKDGQHVPVGQGLPSVLVNKLIVG